MTDDCINHDAGEHPAIAAQEEPEIATYRAYLGMTMPKGIPDDIKGEIAASFMAQGADLNDVATSVHYHQWVGVFLFASAPIRPKAKEGDT